MGPFNIEIFFMDTVYASMHNDKMHFIEYCDCGHATMVIYSIRHVKPVLSEPDLWSLTL